MNAVTTEEASVMDAYSEGMRAGNIGVAAGCNPFAETNSPEYDAWERGRFAAIQVRMARMVA